MNDPPKRNKNFWIVVGEYTSLAFLLPAATIVGYAIGYALDRALGTSFLTIVFLFLGIAAGFVQVIRQVQKDMQDRGD
jgi:ATP synthase protein I